MKICLLCDSKSHAKGLCKKHYTKTEEYKNSRRKSDSEYQLKNSEKIKEVRKKRRTSINYLESESYAKNLLAIEYGLSYKPLNENPYIVKSKQLSLKIKRTIKSKKDE